VTPPTTPTPPATPAQVLRQAAQRIRMDGGRHWQRGMFYAMSSVHDEIDACAVGTINIVSGSVVPYRLRDGSLNIRTDMHDARAHALCQQAIYAAGSLLPAFNESPEANDPRFKLIEFNDTIAQDYNEVALLLEQAAEKLEANYPAYPAYSAEVPA
jgi:hypothetical protein